MKYLNNVLPRFNRYMTEMGRARAREALLRSSDRMLEDAGFSRELLELGVEAWPWQMSASLPPLDYSQIDSATATRELENYSDKELHDLGISKSVIPEPVNFDRDGINNKGERKVA